MAAKGSPRYRLHWNQTAYLVLFFFLFCFVFVFLRQGFSVALAVPELALSTRLVLGLTEIPLPLPPQCWD